MRTIYDNNACGGLIILVSREMGAFVSAWFVTKGKIINRTIRRVHRNSSADPDSSTILGISLRPRNAMPEKSRLHETLHT